MSKLWIIVQEVYRKNVKTWGFFFMVFGPLLMVGLIAGVSYFIGQDQVKSTQGTVGLVNFDQAVVQALKEGDQPNNLEVYPSVDQANLALHEEAIDGYLLDEAGDLSDINYYRQTKDKDILLSPIQSILVDYIITQEALALGLDHDEVDRLQHASVSMTERTLSLDDQGQVVSEKEESFGDMIATGVAYGVSFMVFMFIVTYSSMIGQEIANEKGSRIMEIILSSVSARTHFFGKLIGIGLVILTQILAYVLLGFLAQILIKLSGFGSLIQDFLVDFGMTSLWDVFAPSRSVIALGLIYALIGILIYSSFSAFLGSLASNLEDVQKSMAPISLLAVAGFYIGIYGMMSTNNVVVRAGSFIPFWSPFVMPFRIAAETVSRSELWISIISSFIFSLLILWFSAIFYRSNVLVTSDKGIINTLKSSWSLWKSEREAHRTH